MTDTDRAALFDAILANPDEDDIRLRYADLLDEAEPMRVKCQRCRGKGRMPYADFDRGDNRCAYCIGAGHTLDTSDADLASLIRLQLSEDPPCPAFMYSCHEVSTQGVGGRCNCAGSNYAREREFLLRHPEWLAGLRMPCPWCGKWSPTPPGCKTCGGTGDLLSWNRGTGAIGFLRETGPRNPALHRGITLRVGCRLDEVMREVECPVCEGNGGRVGRDYKEFSGSYEKWETCRQCKGEKRVWQPTPWARAFWQQCVGVQRVPGFGVTDKTPAGPHKCQVRGVWRDVWSWDRQMTMSRAEDIPSPVFDLIKEEYAHTLPNGGRVVKVFFTPDAARSALETAVYEWVRGKITKEARQI